MFAFVIGNYLLSIQPRCRSHSHLRCCSYHFQRYCHRHCPVHLLCPYFQFCLPGFCSPLFLVSSVATSWNKEKKCNKNSGFTSEGKTFVEISITVCVVITLTFMRRFWNQTFTYEKWTHLLSLIKFKALFYSSPEHQLIPGELPISVDLVLWYTFGFEIEFPILCVGVGWKPHATNFACASFDSKLLSCLLSMHSVVECS